MLKGVIGHWIDSDEDPPGCVTSWPVTMVGTHVQGRDHMSNGRSKIVGGVKFRLFFFNNPFLSTAKESQGSHLNPLPSSNQNDLQTFN